MIPSRPSWPPPCCPGPYSCLVGEQAEAQTLQHGQAELECTPTASDSNFGVSSGPGGDGGLPKFDATPHRRLTGACSQPLLTPLPALRGTAHLLPGVETVTHPLLPVAVRGKCLHSPGRKTLCPGSWPTSLGATHPRLWFLVPFPPSGNSQVVSGPAPIG